MERDDEDPVEWDPVSEREETPVEPEAHDAFRGLLTELLFSAAGVPILAIAAACIRDPTIKLRHWGTGAATLPPQWETVLNEWAPPILFLLAFGCLVWLITIPLRMAELTKRKREDENAFSPPQKQHGRDCSRPF